MSVTLGAIDGGAASARRATRSTARTRARARPQYAVRSRSPTRRRSGSAPGVWTARTSRRSSPDDQVRLDAAHGPDPLAERGGHDHGRPRRPGRRRRRRLGGLERRALRRRGLRRVLELASPRPTGSRCRPARLRPARTRSRSREPTSSGTRSARTRSRSRSRAERHPQPQAISLARGRLRSRQR